MSTKSAGLKDILTAQRARSAIRELKEVGKHMKANRAVGASVDLLKKRRNATLKELAKGVAGTGAAYGVPLAAAGYGVHKLRQRGKEKTALSLRGLKGAFTAKNIREGLKEFRGAKDMAAKFPKGDVSKIRKAALKQMLRGALESGAAYGGTAAAGYGAYRGARTLKEKKAGLGSILTGRQLRAGLRRVARTKGKSLTGWKHLLAGSAKTVGTYGGAAAALGYGAHKAHESMQKTAAELIDELAEERALEILLDAGLLE